MKSKRRGRGEGAVFFSEAKQCWIGRAIIGVKPNGSPKRREVSAKTKGKVLDKIKQAEEKARGGISPEAEKTTTGAFLDHWLANVAKTSVCLSTWVAYERCVRVHLKPRIGGIRLGDLRPAHIEELFAGMLRDGVTGGNAKRISAVLNTALVHAGRVEMIDSNPSARVPKPRPAGHVVMPFSPEEIARIREASAGVRMEALFALAIGTGARQGELLALTWDNLDLERGVMTVAKSVAFLAGHGGTIVKEPKSKRGRRKVELPQFAVDALLEHRKRMLAEGNQNAPVFCTRNGRHTTAQNLRAFAYRRLLERAGVPYRKFHTFRHTHVSELLSRGESVVDVARRVGDRPDVILQTYAHYIPDGGKKIARRLDDMYGPKNDQGGDKVELRAASGVS